MTAAPILVLVAAAAILVPSPTTVAAAFAAVPRPAVSPATAPSKPPSPPALVPEVPPAQLERVADLVSSALLPDGGEGDRYAAAREAVATFQRMAASTADADNNTDDADGEAKGNGERKEQVPPSHELVYGELSLPVLATILDAVGVREGDVFLDIGSGDGALVLGASLLYASTDDAAGENNEEEECRRGDAGAAQMMGNNNAVRKSYGVDIVPGLVERSKSHAQKLQSLLHSSDEDHGVLSACQAGVRFLLGDVHAPNEELTRVLAETTVAVCFATTWSAGNARNDNDGDNNEAATIKTTSTSLQGRRLPKLSRALAASLASGCRVVVVDGRLNVEDGFSWRGDLRVHCPDTAPYSVAALYVKE